MNKEQVKGVGKNIAGVIQETAGKVTNNPVQQAKGLEKQASGKVEKAFGDSKEIIKNSFKTP